MYTRPFKGKIYLPRFCVKEGKGKNAEHRPLDYFEHLISRVDVGRFAYSKIDWYLKDEIKQAKDQFADFKDHVFRFQILDEAQSLGRDWRDELREILSEA